MFQTGSQWIGVGAWVGSKIGVGSQTKSQNRTNVGRKRQTDNAWMQTRAFLSQTQRRQARRDAGQVALAGSGFVMTRVGDTREMARRSVRNYVVHYYQKPRWGYSRADWCTDPPTAASFLDRPKEPSPTTPFCRACLLSVQWHPSS